MASPHLISVVRDVPTATTENILRDQKGRTLEEPSRIQCFANRESVDVSFNCTVGAESITQDAAARINATAGDVPIVPDDLLFDTFGDVGDEIIIRATNVNAAAQEARVSIFITPVDDNALMRAQEQLGQVPLLR